MKLLLVVGLGSFIGGVLRYLLSVVIQAKTMSIFPWGTLLVNIAGCFCIGLLFGIANKAGLSTEWKLFLATGVLGGFTTFSAFSLETIQLFRHEHYLPAITYITASIVLGLLTTLTGLAAVKVWS